MSRPRRHNPPRWRRALRNLISASNQVFGVTAQRNRELAAAFVALPTFERESNLTLDRLTRFSDTTKPLVDQLQPVAQQLSPTLEQVRVLAPDLHELFARLGPLVDASRAGLPALQRFLGDLRPLLGQVDPFLPQRQPGLPVPRPVQAGTDRILRERGRVHGGQIPAHERSPRAPVPPHGEPAHASGAHLLSARPRSRARERLPAAGCFRPALHRTARVRLTQLLESQSGASHQLDPGWTCVADPAVRVPLYGPKCARAGVQAAEPICGR